jgi:hypothetical protein
LLVLSEQFDNIVKTIQEWLVMFVRECWEQVAKRSLIC